MHDRPSIELPFSDEFLKAIGNTITRWAYAETEVDHFLLYLRNNPNVKDLAPKLPRPFKARMRLLTDSASICFAECPELLNRIIALSNDLRNLFRERNFLAHGRWQFPRGSELDCILITDGSWAEIHRRRFTVEKIEELAEQIGQAAAQLHILTSLFGHWSLSPIELQALREFQKNFLPRPPVPLLP